MKLQEALENDGNTWVRYFAKYLRASSVKKIKDAVWMMKFDDNDLTIKLHNEGEKKYYEAIYGYQKIGTGYFSEGSDMKKSAEREAKLVSRRIAQEEDEKYDIETKDRYRD